jgi:predicted anti-sigma-YlaC factor YlaD
MKCSAVQPLLSAAHDGALAEQERLAVEQHLAGCAACRQLAAEMVSVSEAYRADAARVSVPDADEEWRLLQARLNAPTRASRRRVAPVVAWIGLPLAAAAAVAFTFFAERAPVAAPLATQVAATEFARADFVDVAERDATPVVFLDKESGVLVVWSVDNTPAVAESGE